MVYHRFHHRGAKVNNIKFDKAYRHALIYQSLQPPRQLQTTFVLWTTDNALAPGRPLAIQNQFLNGQAPAHPNFSAQELSLSKFLHEKIQQCLIISQKSILATECVHSIAVVCILEGPLLKVLLYNYTLIVESFFLCSLYAH